MKKIFLREPLVPKPNNGFETECIFISASAVDLTIAFNYSTVNGVKHTKMGSGLSSSGTTNLL